MFALEVSELAQAIDSKSMQQDDGRPLTFVMIGDPDSVKGCEYSFTALDTAGCAECLAVRHS
jgi:hypothetical protein